MTTAKVIFIYDDNERIEVDAECGLTVLEVARKFDIDLEGACEGALACSTCHVIVDKEFYDKLPKASELEEDMLDLAFGLTKYSRLGCQITISKELDGIRLTIPKFNRNF